MTDVTIDDIVKCLEENISHVQTHIDDGHGLDGAIEAAKSAAKISAWQEILDYIADHRE